MALAQVVLEYIKVLLSPQMIVGIITLVFLQRFRSDVSALMKRIASIKLPGGAELSAPQLERAADEESGGTALPEVAADATLKLPEGIHLSQDQAQAITAVLKAERANAYLWEYRYLNYFLAPTTQRVLDWLASLKERTTHSMYDSWWLPIIPDAHERRVIIHVLQAHHLIAPLEGELISVTPKGYEYIQWRGPLPTPAG